MDKSYIVTVQKDTDEQLFIEIPQELLDSLGWNVGDEVSWDFTEILEDWGEHIGITLSNITKNPDAKNTCK